MVKLPSMLLFTGQAFVDDRLPVFKRTLKFVVHCAGMAVMAFLPVDFRDSFPRRNCAGENVHRADGSIASQLHSEHRNALRLTQLLTLGSWSSFHAAETF
jgi:hypothetical protein